MAKKKGARAKAKKESFGIFLFDVKDLKKKISSLSLHYLLPFALLSTIFFVLYNLLNNELLKSLFYLMALVFAAIAVGLGITILILFVVKFFRKK